MQLIKMEFKMKIRNKKLFKKLNILIDQYCEDDDLNLELSNDLIDLNYEANICDVNLSKLIETAPTFYNEIIKFENKKLFFEFELSLSEILDKDELIILIKELSNLYIVACDSNKRLIDLIKSNEDLHFRITDLTQVRSEND
jgi:hypothetical protein